MSSTSRSHGSAFEVERHVVPSPSYETLAAFSHVTQRICRSGPFLGRTVRFGVQEVRLAEPDAAVDGGCRRRPGVSAIAIAAAACAKRLSAPITKVSKEVIFERAWCASYLTTLGATCRLRPSVPCRSPPSSVRVQRRGSIETRLSRAPSRVSSSSPFEMLYILFKNELGTEISNRSPEVDCPGVLELRRANDGRIYMFSETRSSTPFLFPRNAPLLLIQGMMMAFTIRRA